MPIEATKYGPMLFRRSQTPQDSPELTARVQDILLQLTELRGRMQSLESQWDDMRSQIRKGYQRMEKAAERRDKGPAEHVQEQTELPVGAPAAVGFAKKLQQLKGA